jgi:hypothetical protein
MDKPAKSEDINPKDIKLVDGEKIVWTGQPDLSVFGPLDWIRIPFAIAWLSVAIFVIFNAFHICGTSSALKNGGIFFIGWTLMIFSFGTYGLLSSFISEYQTKKRTRFILTNKRAISKCTWLKGWEKSCNLTEVEDVRKVVDRNGKGIIIFADLPQYQLMQWQLSAIKQMKFSQTPVFFNLANVDKVFSLAQSLSKGDYEQLTVEQPLAPAVLPDKSSDLSPGRKLDPGIFGDYLRPGEKLLWKGQPDMNISLTRKPEMLGLLGVPLAASVLSILPYIIISSMEAWKIEYFLFVWIGSFLLVLLLSLSQEVAMRKRVHYAISDQRVIELMNIVYSQTICKYLDIANLRHMNKSLYSDGTGSVYFTPPAKGLAAALFGQEAVLFTNLNPLLRKEPIFMVLQKPEAVVRMIRDLRQKKGLSDISIPGSKNQNLANVANASLKHIGNERRISQLLVARMFLFSQAASSAWVAAVILTILVSIAITMLAKGQFHSSGGFFDLWIIGVLLIGAFGAVFLINQLIKTQQAIVLLKNGACAQGTRLSDERVIVYVNRQPSLCQRGYEFSVGGQIYQVKSITGVNQPRPKNVTILFDPINPDSAVVLDDLPGGPVISADDMAVEYANNPI